LRLDREPHAEKLSPIANFPKDFWHVSLLGAITQNPTSTTENNIRVHLGRLVVLPEDAGTQTAVDRKQYQVEEVTIGSLPLIHAGSVWMHLRKKDIGRVYST
jgi:hypothetical protein